MSDVCATRRRGALAEFFCSPGLPEVGRDPRGPDHAGRNRIGAHAERAELLGRRAHQRHQAGFRRPVCRVHRRRGDAGHRRDEGEGAAAVLSHLPAEEPGEQLRMAQHDPKVPVPILVVAVDHCAVAGHADDVDDGVDLAELCLCVAQQPLDLFAVGRVAAPGDAPDLFGDLLRQVLLQVDAEHPRTGL